MSSSQWKSPCVTRSRPARSWSLTITARASWNFSRKRTSIMHVSSGRPHMLTSNQRGRGQEPVTVLGSVRFAVAVNIGHPLACLLRKGRRYHGAGPAMELDEAREAEIRDALERLDRLIPKDGAHVAIAAEPGGRT